MANTVISIYQKESGGWRVKLSQGGRLFDLPTRESAQRFAANWALENKPCEVWVFRPDGEFENAVRYL
jgi:hypothetical protein